MVTGHTGFKGGWLALWLQRLGAHVAGYALDPPTQPSLFEIASVSDAAIDNRGDIRDALRTRDAFVAFDPEIVFHLAAQPIVREGYRAPVDTYATNVVGTASVLDACRASPGVRAIVVVTTDKCYENREWDRAYVESDALGGHDPYSNSKACTELVTDAFRRSFFATGAPRVGVATARAGNVVGGGDWAADRLVPDLVRARMHGAEALIRNPRATRPWQHVLEPLHGYLLLAEALLRDPEGFSHAWNFGPAPGGDRPVQDVVTALSRQWPDLRWRVDTSEHPHEAHKLMLDSTQAIERLGWRPRLDFDRTLALTARWYGAYAEGGKDMRAETASEIDEFVRAG